MNAQSLIVSDNAVTTHIHIFLICIHICMCINTTYRSPRGTFGWCRVYALNRILFRSLQGVGTL